ncbi:MAG: substrate-binding domain-containing protein [Syntrophobacteraceae bacterium]|nr:substrate-binding domain-containing protein [Syntrophobacteraceae bacterium]
MKIEKDQVVCNLRPVRQAKGLSQSELALRVGVKRQAVYDMETGRYVPNTALALRIARELGCRVETLFALDDSEEEKPVTLIEKAAPNTRVSVASVRDRLVAYPLDGKWLLHDGFEAADGVLSPDSDRVQLLHGGLEKKILLLGCDPAFAILGARASLRSADVSVQCRFASSRLALERVASGCAHIAGTHLHNLPSVESNLSFAQKMMAGVKSMVVAFSFFEEGLMVSPGNPRRIRSVADLAREGTRFVNREPGAALRTLLDERLAQVGISGDLIEGYDKLVPSHNLCAQMVAFSMADAAPGLRAIAAAYGLDFVPMEAVRCDLVIPSDFLDLPAVKVLLDVLQTRSLRDELSALPGYESSCTGTVIGEVS